MSLRSSWLAAAALLALAVSGTAAEFKDAVDLLPAQTLACLEVRHPERLSREVAALVKGSSLEDLPATMARFRAKIGSNDRIWFGEEISILGMFLSPELINEGGRIGGACVAVTGISKEHGPEIVGIIQAGDSNLPTLYMRAYLSLSDTRSVGQAEGVTIYREMQYRWNAGAPGQPGRSTQELGGPFMTLLPNTLVFCSTAEGVKDVIRRFKGKSSAPSLTSVSAYKDAAPLRKRPGLFAYADTAALAAQMDRVLKNPNMASLAHEWKVFRGLVHPEAFRTVTASLTLLNGNVDLLVRADLDDRQKNPFLDLIPDRPARLELLRFVPRDAVLAAAMDLGDGTRRWNTLLGMLDGIARSTGKEERRFPSKALEQLEEKLGMSIGKDVLGRVAGVAVAVDVPGGPSAPGGPLLVLRARDADAAKFLQARALPGLLGLLTRGEPPAPARKEVGGHEIQTFPVPLLPGSTALCVGRLGSTLVFGGDGKRVAAALSAGAAKEGLLGEPKIAAALKELDRPVVAGVVSLGQVAVQTMRLMEGPRMVSRPKAPGKPGKKQETPEEDKYVRALSLAVEPLPPAVFSLRRGPDALTFQMRQTSLRKATPRVLTLWVDAALERAAARYANMRAGGGPMAAPPVAVPAEAPKVEKKEADKPAKEKKKPEKKTEAPAEKKRG